MLENIRRHLHRCQRQLLTSRVFKSNRCRSSSCSQLQFKGHDSSNDSGKKKGTTVKNNIITQRRKGGKVRYLSETVEGKRHDKKLADDENYQFPKRSKLWQDTGFQGYAPENVTIFQPKKKPRGGALTSAQKSTYAKRAGVCNCQRYFGTN